MQKPTLTLIIAFLCSIFCHLYAQQKCAFDNIRLQQLQDSTYLELEKAAEKKLQKILKNKDLSKMAGTVLTIPIVIHVLHLGEAEGTGTNISEAQIQSSIDNLNDYYRGQIPTSTVDFEIEFVLAQRDPDCNATNGINRIDASGLSGYSDYGVNVQNSNGASYNDIVNLINWPQTDYFNIWIVTELDGNDGGYGYQGYAYFYNETFSTHGSVMMSTVFGYDPGNTNGWGLNSNGDNSTVVHEVGHFFHLYHTFQGDGTGNDCPLDNTVGVDSDGCADTVPHKRETSTCPAINSCTLAPWLDNNTINNIMGYYYCSDRLTNDQKSRARAAMEGTTLASSKGHIPPDSNYEPPVNVCTINNANNLTSASGIIRVELSGTTINSGTTGSDGGNLDLSSNCSTYFEIDADVANSLEVELWNNFNQLGVWIDWNDDGDFLDEAEQQHFSQDIGAFSTISINLTYPSVIPYGDYVRIRIITELDDRYGGVDLIDSACYSSLVYGQSEDYTIHVQSLGTTTYTYNNSWSPSNPVGQSTTADTIIIESGTALIDADTDCNTLTVNPGAALTINSGITLNATIVDLNSSSQLFSSLISDGTITGVVNYHRYASLVGPVGTNDLISAPVSGQLFPAFALLNDNLPASGNLRAFAPYNTSAGAYQNYDIINNVLTTIDAGVGYRTSTMDSGTLTFTGTVRTDDVLDVPITDATAGYGWNLIGNPYPSYVDFDTFFNFNASQFAADDFQAIYGYDGDASNGWTVWNLATIADTNITELIAPGQGFFVKSKTGGGLVDFTTDMRRASTSDDFIEGRPTNNNVALCQLNLSSVSNESSTKIYFIEGTTRGLDVGYDASRYTGSNTEFSIFSNLVEDDNGLDMAIQSLPYQDFNDVVIPLGVKAVAGQTLTISIDNTSTLSSSINVYLEDRVSNSWTLLSDEDYTFTPISDLSGTGRFYIHYSAALLSTNDSKRNNLQIYSTSSPKEIIISGNLNDNSVATLYNIEGRIVLTQQLEKTNKYNRINISELSSGIYVIKVLNENLKLSKKLVVN